MHLSVKYVHVVYGDNGDRTEWELKVAHAPVMDGNDNSQTDVVLRAVIEALMNRPVGARYTVTVDGVVAHREPPQDIAELMGRS